MRSETWYNRKLQKYFDEHYVEYEETAGYYVNPSINVWKFEIPEKGIKVTLTCEDNGNIIENIYRIPKGGGVDLWLDY